MAKSTVFLILLTVLQIPIGLTPGHLSRALSRHGGKRKMPFGSTRVSKAFLLRGLRNG